MIEPNTALRKLILVGVLTVVAAGMASGEELKDERMEWFRGAKFGMLVHWGVDSVHLDTEGKSRSEAIELQAKQLNPVRFDADEWIRIAKDAGARYVTFTTKHHGGFCNWDSALTDWDVMDSRRA